MDNIDNSGTVGATWTIFIPGTNSPVPNAYKNNSPVFPVNDTVVICQNNYFEYPISATDPDGDSLSYMFCNAYPGASQGNPVPASASPPPYFSLPST